ncbi:hypothetical protein BDB00DRAFT_812238 [Zychaea mexicana]|uniref:uncharacterized protein n=1 Tax=Zychaea mexicana TaxID=64656 RepID=UPI0022FE0447|nr:uncharacterized protein BDB00DRAFT_812238 [Zychaea mexicana]KAI9495873.1 hypothetical protein BDB00DRAFT_812238 [Zychaea mexicana]
MTLSTTLTSYAAFIVAVPLLVQWNYFRQIVLYAMSIGLGLYEIPADFATISLGLTALYTYVLAGFIADVSETLNEKYRRVFAGMAEGSEKLKQLFPGYAVSAYLLKANTNLYYTQSKAFLFLQSLLLVLVPFSASYPGLQKTHAIAYRCALAWTLVYSLFPRETMHMLWLISQVLQQQFSYHPRVYSEEYVV